MSSPFIACWSVKGGSGATTVAAALALRLARQSPQGSLLVDLDGDLEAALGLGARGAAGVTDWLGAGSGVPPDGLARLEVPVTDGLHLLPRGAAPERRSTRAEVLAGVLASDPRPVVVDCGVIGPCATDRLHVVADRRWASVGAGGVAGLLAARATTSLLVIRSCYLALSRVRSVPIEPSGVIVVAEPGRALQPRDVSQVIGRPLVATVPWDAAVSRAIDSGVFVGRHLKALDGLTAVAA